MTNLIELKNAAATKIFKVYFVYNNKADCAWTQAQTVLEAEANILKRFPKSCLLNVKG